MDAKPRVLAWVMGAPPVAGRLDEAGPPHQSLVPRNYTPDNQPRRTKLRRAADSFAHLPPSAPTHDSEAGREKGHDVWGPWPTQSPVSR
jgi:hypothetical protein